ncbi:hypothetical protein BJ138DRAFT_1141072 [Hygrophoropsis aurantiaca]|uniref:Uncharacterized protein n=1 Tax=Hygrophoropsis aurantiaca TaxID=72124 RepID=A0ACB8AR91_9AGAM|nr:hypothetical protein BJ138DRAFT_1141072 [Hygrophoropsis aurantiaca]
MAPSRASASSTSNINSVYSLSLLSEYTHSLDSLPIDLSRNFADLRELDAVLSSSMASITAKIQRLTEIIEQGVVPKQERLFLLTEIAEEAARLKLGGEDKIRVACQAADNLKGHTNHMKTLLSLFPSFDMTTLNRTTTYPHVAPRSFMPLPEPSRRRRNYGSLLSAPVGNEFSPAKRKRVAREDDLDVGGGKSPRKEKTADVAGQRSRNGARARKERAASPTESVLSVISHNPVPPPQTHASSSRAGGASSRAANGANKRSRPSASTVASSKFENDQPINGTRREIFAAPPSSSVSHPSLPPPYSVGPGLHSYDPPGGRTIPPTDWAGPSGQLAGPGIPVERNVHPLPITHGLVTHNLPLSTEGQGNSAVDTATEAGEADGEGDDRTYCFCDGISYGEMIACDDTACEREWFHLACIGLTVPPDGTWYCETCKTKQRNAKRSRGGKKRTGGGARAGGRAANS